MPRYFHPKKAEAGSAAAYAIEMLEQSEPSRLQIIKPPEPAAEESDISQSSMRCISDRISRDSLVGLVCKATSAKTNLQISEHYTPGKTNLQINQLKKRLQEQQSKGIKDESTLVSNSDYELYFSNGLTRSKDKYDGDGNHSNHKQSHQPPNRRDSQRGCKQNHSEDNTNDLIELLFSRVFGCNRQMLRKRACACIESSIGGKNDNYRASSDDEVVAATKSREMSELMTLNDGDRSDSLLTQYLGATETLQTCTTTAAASPTVMTMAAIDFQVDQSNRSDIPSSKSCIINAKKAGAAPESVASPALVVAPTLVASPTSVATPKPIAAPTSVAESTTCIARPATLSVHEEAIPLSERIDKSFCRDSKSEVVSSNIVSHSEDVRGPSKFTIQSKIVLEMENVSHSSDNERTDCPLCICPCNRLNCSPTGVGRSRFGRLRTPEICKRILTNASTSPHSDTLEISAMMEWKESRRPSAAKSSSDRHFDIDSSDDEQRTFRDSRNNASDHRSTSHGTSQSRRPNSRQGRKVERRKLREQSAKKSMSSKRKPEKRVDDKQVRRERQKKRGEKNRKPDKRGADEPEKQQPRRQQRRLKSRQRCSYDSP